MIINRVVEINSHFPSVLSFERLFRASLEDDNNYTSNQFFIQLNHWSEEDKGGVLNANWPNYPEETTGCS